jgi:XTP/dITP diphosphohydrolase
MYVILPSFFSPMKEIVFATNNSHKLSEIIQIVSRDFKIISLSELGLKEEIPETADTITGNALLKARYVYDKFGVDCFADDTGLEVDALNGRPGVYSARYAGPNCSYTDNVNKLLEEMKELTNRKARFVTVIALIINNQEYLFEGTVHGYITTEPRGSNGFGYDPVFELDTNKQTYAEMETETKNSISHRGQAMQKLIRFLKKMSETATDH